MSYPRSEETTEAYRRYERRVAHTDPVALTYGFLTCVGVNMVGFLIVPWIRVFACLSRTLSPETVILIGQLLWVHLASHAAGRVTYQSAYRDDEVGRFDRSDHAWLNVRLLVVILLVVQVPLVALAPSGFGGLALLLTPLSIWSGARVSARQNES